MNRKTRFIGLLLLAQTGCIAAGIGLQHYCIRWSARETILNKRLSTMADEAATLVPMLNQHAGLALTPSGSPGTRSHPPGDLRETLGGLVSPCSGVLLADEGWRVRFAARASASSVSERIGEGEQLQWMPLNDVGKPRPDTTEEAFGALQLHGATHFAVARPLPDSGGFLVVHQPEAALEEDVSMLLNGLPGVSLMTLIWTVGLLGVAGALLAGRFLDEIERDRSRSLNDALRQRRDLARTQDAVIVGLAKLAESRDPGTGDHLDRISMYATMLATALMRDPEFMVEVTPSFVRLIGISAALHDIGKVGVADRILLKPGRLTAAERSQMEEHSRIGGECLREIERRLGRSNFLQMAREIAFSHHEHWDGSGYPAGLAGTEIPLAARIVAIGDVYDALSSRRVYKEPLAHDKCVAIIREGAGSQFDPRIVEVWMTVAGKFREIAERYSSSRASALNEYVADQGAGADGARVAPAAVVAAGVELPVIGDRRLSLIERRRSSKM